MSEYDKNRIRELEKEIAQLKAELEEPTPDKNVKKKSKKKK